MHAGGLSVRENKVREVNVREYLIKSGITLVNFSADFSGISDLRSVDNCLKMTSHNGFVDNESKTIILDT